MNSPPNWEELLDIDDSDLRLSTKTTDIPEAVNDGGVMETQEYIWKVVHDVGEDSDFNSGPWVRAVDYMKPEEDCLMVGYFADVKKFIKKGNLDKVVAIIKSCTPNVLGDLTVTLKDVSGLMSGTIHHKVLNDERFEKKMVVGTVLILHNVSVFSPKQSGNHYLNITIRNIVKVFPPDDTVPDNGSDVGSNESVKLSKTSP
ncbi:hypothetical protein CTI12_AA027940 [Artemisia annua]|uniref:Homologous recombination OB-fold protein OB-fold domain-containing protein n=1 Tax=Artemisia annua TaxID=35608 RepID=A0A2U1QEV6_ARTAN|nr:hypothetical protein CTI12_AA027940 [Artemisia annua]